MYTISRIGEVFSLSRSTLLYYDSIGLLKASQRSPAGYRLYSDEDKSRLEKIRQLRDLGIPLLRIREHLSSPDSGTGILLQRIFTINDHISTLRDQQRQILTMLEKDGSLRGAIRHPRKQAHLAEKVSVTRQNYRSVHRMFEKASPASHRRFLRFLGFTEIEISALLKEMKKRP